MKKDTTIPDWYNHNMKDEDVLQVVSGITASDGDHFFTGVIRELIRARKIPIAIDIAFDMDESAVVARLEYEPGGDGKNSESRWRALYTYLDFEAFALLWNETPDLIHGIPSERISLHLHANDMEIVKAVGIHSAIIFYNEDDQSFHFAPGDVPITKEAA